MRDAKWGLFPALWMSVLAFRGSSAYNIDRFASAAVIAGEKRDIFEKREDVPHESTCQSSKKGGGCVQ